MSSGLITPMAVEPIMTITPLLLTLMTRAKEVEMTIRRKSHCPRCPVSVVHIAVT